MQKCFHYRVRSVQVSYQNIGEQCSRTFLRLVIAIGVCQRCLRLLNWRLRCLLHFLVAHICNHPVSETRNCGFVSILIVVIVYILNWELPYSRWNILNSLCQSSYFNCKVLYKTIRIFPSTVCAEETKTRLASTPPMWCLFYAVPDVEFVTV